MYSSREDHRTRLHIAAACTALVLGGCLMQNQTAPPLMGPSGFGRKLTMTATPDTLPRDGSSQSVIRVSYRDGVTDAPLTQRRIVLSATAGTLSVGEVVTDSNGDAAFTFIAPGVDVPVRFVSVVATPVDDNSDNALPQTVGLTVMGPDVPIASFTFAPAAPVLSGIVTFDAGATTLGGYACGTACTYEWDFGDGSAASGMLAQHAYLVTGVQTVTLTVRSPQGTSSTASRLLAIMTPPLPVAAFTVAPASPSSGSSAVFNATTTTAGAGTTITEYLWDFGDGSALVSTAVPITTHTYAAPGTVAVTLVVTDSLGRTATITVPVTVV